MRKIALSSLVVFTLFAITAHAQSYQFSSNLQVGSTGADVSALQSWLIQNGYNILSIGNGSAAKGRFGSQTKAAVIAYQKASGLPATGFVGPLTRAELNGTNSTSTDTTSASTTAATGAMNAAMMANLSPAEQAAVAAGFTTFGAEGVMSVTQGPLSNTTLYAGQTQAPIFDIRVQAQYSDIDIAGLVLDLGSDTTLSNYVFSKIYVTDGTNILATVPVNPTTVVEVSGQYVIDTQGYNFVVPKGTYKDIVIKADLDPTISTTITGESPWYISIDPGSVGGVDGVNQDLFGPPQGGGSLVEALTINQNLVTTATANIALDASSPLTGSVGVTNATQGQYLGLPIMTFDVNAQGDSLHLHQVAVGINVTGTGASVPVAYLFNGSMEVSSAAIVNGVATFANITDGTAGATIPINSFTPFTVKVDVAGLTGSNGPAVINASTSALVIYNSMDSNVSTTGVATANAQTVFGEGPVFSLSGAPTITNSVVSSNSTAGTSTIKYTATFNVNVQAIGESVTFGLPGAASVTHAAFGSSTTATGIAAIYLNGSQAVGGPVLSASYSQPANTTVNGNYFTLSQNQSATIPVTYSFLVNGPTSGQYAVQINGINWGATSNGGGADNLTNFMSNQTMWRTSAI